MNYQSLIVETSILPTEEQLRQVLPTQLHKLLRADHPDVYILNRQGKASIADVRSLSSRLQLKSVDNGEKLAIILNAQSLGIQAQNALLKLLEEPPPDTQIVLVTNNTSSLLGTIKSRAHQTKLQIDGVEESELLQIARSFMLGSLIEKEKIIDKILKTDNSRETVSQMLQLCLEIITTEIKSSPQKQYDKFVVNALKTAIQNTYHSGNLKLTLQTLAISMN